MYQERKDACLVVFIPRWSPSFCFKLPFTPSRALFVFGTKELVKKRKNVSWSTVSSLQARLRFPWVYHHFLVIPASASVFSLSRCPYSCSHRRRSLFQIMGSCDSSICGKRDAIHRSFCVAAKGLCLGSKRLACRTIWARHRW